MPRVAQAVMLLVLVVGILATSVAVLGHAYEDTPTHVEHVENETLTQDVGNWTATNSTTETGAVQWYDNETVYANESGGLLSGGNTVQLVEGEDYKWSTENGSVYWYDTSNTTDGSPANVSYAYDSRPVQANTMIGPLAMLIDMLGIFPLVIIAGVSFLALRQLASVLDGPHGRRR